MSLSSPYVGPSFSGLRRAFLAGTLGFVVTTSVAADPALSPVRISPQKVSPLVETIVGSTATDMPTSSLKHGARPARRQFAHARHRNVSPNVERPALAGVLLVEPLAPAYVEPRPIVPMPAFFVDGVVSGFTTPPPPVVCQRRPRDRDLPDPRLYREAPVVCAYEPS